MVCGGFGERAVGILGAKNWQFERIGDYRQRVARKNLWRTSANSLRSHNSVKRARFSSDANRPAKNCESSSSIRTRLVISLMKTVLVSSAIASHSGQRLSLSIFVPRNTDYRAAAVGCQRRYLGSTKVFLRISRLQFGHFVGRLQNVIRRARKLNGQSNKAHIQPISAQLE